MTLGTGDEAAPSGIPTAFSQKGRPVARRLGRLCVRSLSGPSVGLCGGCNCCRAACPSPASLPPESHPKVVWLVKSVTPSSPQPLCHIQRRAGPEAPTQGRCPTVTGPGTRQRLPPSTPVCGLQAQLPTWPCLSQPPVQALSACASCSHTSFSWTMGLLPLGLGPTVPPS